MSVPRKKHARVESAPRDDRSSKKEPKRAENDRDTSLQSWEVRTLVLPRWPAVAVGASVPVFQAVLVPLALSAPPGALAFDAARLPPPPELFDGLVAAPLCETLVFQCWLLEACRRAGFAYVPSVLGAAACFGAWHGAAPTSAFLALLGAYWGHLYAQTRSALVPATMHALWNALALGVAASLAPPS